VQPRPPLAFADAGAIPELDFEVLGAGPLARAAVPTLRFDVRVRSRDGAAIRSVVLETQIQIAARRRAYDDEAETRLYELFGEPERWGSTLRTLLWTRTTQVVPAFTGETIAEIAVPCTYDFEVAASRYLDAVRDGVVPLELLFGGTLFYAGSDGRLQTARIAWDREAEYGLPAGVWRETMDRSFPGAAWVRLGRESFDRLQAHKVAGAFVSLDAAIDDLLGER
jgi:hypothetical protein